MTAIQEQTPKKPLPELPKTELGKLVITRAWKALITDRETLLIKQEDIESHRNDINDILQYCGYSGTDLVRGRRLSKKLYRNLASAVLEILYHNPRFQGRFFLILRETREQDEPYIPTQFSSISLKSRDHPSKDPDSEVDCVTVSVKPKKKKPRGRKPRF